MNTKQQRRLHDLLAIGAMLCSVISLFALFEMGAPAWISSLNVLAVILIILAIRTRGRRSDSDSG